MSASGSTTSPNGESHRALTIAVELKAEDVVRAHFWTLAQLPAIRILVATNGLVTLGLALVVVRNAFRAEPVWIPLAGLVTLVLLYAVLPIQVQRGARRRFDQMKEAERRGTYTLTENGFSWSMGRSPGKLPWSVVSKTAETDDYFYWMTPLARTHVVPKRDLTPDQEQTIPELLAHAQSGEP